MARKTTEMRVDNGGRKSYGTYYSREYPRLDSDMYFMAQEGDRCDLLANSFYGNPNFWWYIAKINNLKTMNIPAGTHLRIPVKVVE